MMGSSVLTARDSVLCSLVLQARPLMQMVEQEKRIASLAVEQFMHYISSRDNEVRQMLVKWLVGGGWEQLVRQLSENKLLSGQSDSCWDWRLLPDSAVRDKAGCSENISNRMDLVLRVMVEAKELQDKLSTSPSCRLVKSSLSSVSLLWLPAVRQSGG